MVKIGIGVPTTIPGVSGDLLLEWARRADAAGFSSLSFIDRIAYPNYELMATLGAQGVAPAAVEQQMAAGNSINHLVDATEVAWVVAFLCSPKSRAINGDAVAVGGGVPRAIHY